MKVTAIKRGFIHGQYRRVGDEFECSEQEFSTIWMIEGDYEAPDDIDNSKATCAEEIEHEPLEIPSLMNKPKRKRRTPAEMEAARAEKANQEK